MRRKHFQGKKEERLINALRIINQYRGIHKVKVSLEGKELETFRRILSDLASINVNPVTIPRDWNIPRIPNLLDTYDGRIENAISEKRQEEMMEEILEDY